MDVSVIIATYKRPNILVNALESFTRLDTKGIEWEIVLADNADDPETKLLADQYADKLPIVYLVERRRGKSCALNKAIGVAKGALFVFADDDIIADQNWLRELWTGAGRWPDFNVFGSSISPHWPKGKKPIENIQKEFFNAAYVIAEWNYGEGQYPAGKVWGPTMAIRKEIFNKGWKFNENIGPKGKNYLVGDETDLTKRLEKAGFPSVYLPKVKVLHQIREEQLSAKWLYQRAFIHGRSDVFYRDKEKGEASLLFGVPRYLYRVWVELLFKRMIASLSFNKSKITNAGIDFWTVKGYIYQFRLGEFNDPNEH